MSRASNAKPSQGATGTEAATQTATAPAAEPQAPEATEGDTSTAGTEATTPPAAPPASQPEVQGATQTEASTASETQSPASVSTRPFEVAWAVRHDGKRYEAGETVNLDERSFSQLASTGVLGRV